MSPAFRFIALTFALTLPFLLFGRTGAELVPGAPIAALAALCPGLAVLILSDRTDRTRLWHRLRARPGAIWLVTALLLPPASMAASYGLARVSGTALPAPVIGPAEFTILACGTLVLALTEEVGWSFWLFPALAPPLRPLAAALVIGAVWAVWHVPALLLVGRDARWIVWWALGTIASRVVLVWLYRSGKEALILPILYHAMINVAWQVYPVRGSFYDPRLTALVTTGLALAVAVLTRGHLRPAGRARAN